MFYLILENLRSLYNVGAIFRTADACGVKKIFLVGSSGILLKNIINPKVSKTALGTEKIIPWQYFRTTQETLNNLPQKTKIISLEQTANSKNLFFNLKSSILNHNFALIIGNEKTGVSQTALQKSDQILHIPMYGRHNSLNASVAAGIGLYWLKNCLSTSVKCN